MRRVCLLLCLLLSANLGVAPLSMLHAHVADADHAHVHGGHAHDFDSRDESHAAGLVVDLGTAQDTAPIQASWTSFLAILCIAVLSWAILPFVVGILRPPSRDSELIFRRICRPPPLRGPPPVSI